MAKTSIGAESARNNVIPFPARNSEPDPALRFRRAHRVAEVARCEWKLREALSGVAQLDGVNTAEGEYREARDNAFEEFRVKALTLALTPAPNRGSLDLKRELIGRVWLRAEGEFYDMLRAGIEIDRERLGQASGQSNRIGRK